MLSISDLESFKTELSDPEVRRLRIESQIRAGIPLQIRAMREMRGWTQGQLAEKIGTTQNTISRLENPRSATPNVSTLERLADAFDVGLIVQFVPFSQFFDTGRRMSRNSVAVPDFPSELSELERRRDQQPGEAPVKPEYLGATESFDRPFGGARINAETASLLMNYLQRWLKSANIMELSQIRRSQMGIAENVGPQATNSLSPSAEPCRQIRQTA